MSIRKHPVYRVDVCVYCKKRNIVDKESKMCKDCETLKKLEENII